MYLLDYYRDANDNILRSIINLITTCYFYNIYYFTKLKLVISTCIAIKNWMFNPQVYSYGVLACVSTIDGSVKQKRL